MPGRQIGAAAKLAAICPQFVVPDVVAAAEYYRDVLGFRILGYFFDPPVFAMVARDAVEIHFGKADEGATPSPILARRRELGIDAYIWVNDLDALHAELQERHAKIIEPRFFALRSATSSQSKISTASVWSFPWTSSTRAADSAVCPSGGGNGRQLLCFPHLPKGRLSLPSLQRGPPLFAHHIPPCPKYWLPNAFGWTLG